MGLKTLITLRNGLKVTTPLDKFDIMKSTEQAKWIYIPDSNGLGAYVNRDAIDTLESMDGDL